MARPKKFKESVVSFRVDGETLASVDALAEESGVPRSIMLDSLVVAAVEDEGRKARALDVASRAARIEAKNLRAHLLRAVAEGLDTYDG